VNPVDPAAYNWTTATATLDHNHDARTLLRALAVEGMTDAGEAAALRICLPNTTEVQRQRLWTVLTDAVYAIDHAGDYAESPEIVDCAEQEIDHAFRAVGL
jgi:hypothetical protein